MGCPDADSVRVAVEELSGAQVVPEGADVVATGAVTLVDAGYALALDVDDGSGVQSRTLDAADCGVLARAAALVVVVALDPVRLATQWPERTEAPERTEPERTEEPEPEVQPEPIPEPEEEPAPERTVPPEPDRLDLGPLEYGVGVRVGVAGRTLPGVGASLELAPFIGVPRLHGRLVAQYRTPRTTTLADNAEAGARFQLAAAGLRVCPNVVPKPGRVRVPVCAGADFGVVQATPRGVAVQNGNDVASFWSAATLEAGVVVQVARWLSLSGAFEAGIALSRPKFRLDGGGRLHSVARFAPRGMLGVQFHRPRPLR